MLNMNISEKSYLYLLMLNLIEQQTKDLVAVFTNFCEKYIPSKLEVQYKNGMYLLHLILVDILSMLIVH